MNCSALVTLEMLKLKTFVFVFCNFNLSHRSCFWSFPQGSEQIHWFAEIFKFFETITHTQILVMVHCPYHADKLTGTAEEQRQRRQEPPKRQKRK